MKFKVFDVFTQRPYEGSPTAVVYYGGVVDKERMHRIAGELGFRDTFFILPANDPDLLFSSHTFTPHQELAVCGQGMVAGLFALLDDGRIGPGRYALGIALGERSAWLVEDDGPVAYAAIGAPAVSDLPREHDDLARILGREVASSGPRRLVDVGRSRLVVRVAPGVLEDVHPTPPEVLKVCSMLDITGVVFFSTDPENPASVRSRVFTKSLKGYEDPTTGGAAAAILGFLREFSPHDPPSRLLVHQGDFATRGGLIYTRWDEETGQAVAGGRAVKIAEGNLYL